MTKELDLLPTLNQFINSLGLSAESKIGDLYGSKAISIMPLPGGDEIPYFDGTRDKIFNVQVDAKSNEQQECLNWLSHVYQKLENLSELPSSNDSYEFLTITTTSYPSLYQVDDKGFFYYQISIQIKITIEKGVEI